MTISVLWKSPSTQGAPREDENLHHVGLDACQSHGANEREAKAAPVDPDVAGSGGT